MTSAEPFELHDTELRDQRLSAVELPPQSEVVDVALVDCDIAGLVAQQSRAERLRISGTRLRGVTWAGGILRDLTLDAVTGSDVSCRFSTLRRVVVTDSQLPGLDLTEAELDEVRFERCDLSRARFDHVRVKSLRIQECDLTGVTGAVNLRGASMSLEDVLSLAPSLAREVGIDLD